MTCDPLGFLFRKIPVHTLMGWAIIATAPLSAQTAETFNRMDLLDSSRVIRTDDRLTYQVLEEQNPAVTLFVDTAGNALIPLIGEFPVVGKTCKLLATELRDLLEVDFFHRATVIIELQSAQIRQIATVYGQVRNQGRISLPADRALTLSGAISQAGGFVEGADLMNVAIIRRDPSNPEKEDRTIVNLKEVLDRGLVENDLVIQSDDVIIVSRENVIGGQYSVHGAVNKPGLYTISDRNLTLSRAILLAEGFSEVARETRVKLTRLRDDGSNRSDTFYVNVRRVYDGFRDEDMEVKPNDIIRVDERILVF